MKLVSIFAAFLLFLAIFHLPIGYYTFMRIGVSLSAFYLLNIEIKRGINIWVIIIGVIGVLFNPIFPVYLGSKSIWLPIDIITCVIFLIFALTKTNKYN